MAVAPEHVITILTGLTDQGGLSLRSAPRGFPTRVVLEKPVGRDAYSAGALLQGVEGLTDPGCVLIADHYLAKAGVIATAGIRSRMVNDLHLGKASAAPYRPDDPNVDVTSPPPPGSGTTHHRFDDREGWVRLATTMRYTEVTMIEGEDVAGRSGFYNQHGVVRDVMQSHMSVLAQAALMLPRGKWDSSGREMLLREFYPMQKAAGSEGGSASLGADGKPIPQLTHSSLPGALAPHRFGAYLGYAQTVQAEAAGGGAGGKAKGGKKAESALHYPVRLSKQPAISDVSAFVRKHGRSPLSSEVWNTSSSSDVTPFVTATAAQVVMSAIGVPLVLSAGKALGMRSAYVRQYFTPAIPPPAACGPITVTYHIHGEVVLPPGAEPGSWPPHFPTPASIAASQGPAVIFSGFCGETVAAGMLPDPRSLFRGAYVSPDWPSSWEWTVHYDPHTGTVLALPSLPSSPAPSSTLTSWALAEGRLVLDLPNMGNKSASDSDKADDEAEEEHPLLTTLRARSSLAYASPRIVRSRLRVLSEAPGRASGDAYRIMLAAALAGERSRFQSPGEVQALWRLWEPIAALQDETMATGKALHWGRSDLQARYDNERRRREKQRHEEEAAARRKKGVYDDDEEDEEEENSADVSLSGDLVYVYPPGDRSWLRGLPPPLPLAPRAPKGGVYASPSPSPSQQQQQASSEAAAASSSPSPRGAVVARLVGSDPSRPSVPVEAVVASGPGADVSSQFASDVTGLIWDGLRCHPHPFVHWAVDAGPEMTVLLDRWPSMDVLAHVPWHALHLWQTAERRADASSPDCNLCYLIGVFAQRVNLPDSQVHSLLHPNVSHVNGLARAALSGSPGGGFDLVTLRVPGANISTGPGGFSGLLPLMANYSSHPYLRGTGQPSLLVSLNRTAGHLARVPELAEVLPKTSAAGGSKGKKKGPPSVAVAVDPSHPETLRALGRVDFDAASLASGDFDHFISAGLGLAEAIEQEAIIRSNLTSDQLAEIELTSRPPPLKATRATGGGKQAAVPWIERGSPDFSSVPPRPLLPYNGPVDIRISPASLHAARHVWVVVPESRLGAHPVTAPAAHQQQQHASAAISSQGGVVAASAVIEGNTVGGLHFPLDLVDDLQWVTAERRGPVRIYIVKGI